MPIAPRGQAIRICFVTFAWVGGVRIFLDDHRPYTCPPVRSIHGHKTTMDLKVITKENRVETIHFVYPRELVRLWLPSPPRRWQVHNQSWTETDVSTSCQDSTSPCMDTPFPFIAVRYSECLSGLSSGGRYKTLQRTRQSDQDDAHHHDAFVHYSPSHSLFSRSRNSEARL